MPRKKTSEPTGDRHYPSRPVVGVGIVIWRGDKILLVKRARPPGEGEWGLPGGVQKLGETIYEAAIREAREETGLTITPLGIITAIDALVSDKKGQFEYHYTIVEVAAESPEGEAAAGDDVSELQWVNIETIKDLCAWPEVERVVRMSVLHKIL